MPKISELVPLDAADVADELPIKDASAGSGSGSVKRMSLATFKTWLQSLAKWVTTTMLADLAVTTQKVKPNYFQTEGTTGGGRQTMTGNNLYQIVTGSTFTYTSGPTNEIVSLSAFALIMSATAGGQLGIFADNTRIGRTSYDGGTPGAWFNHKPDGIYEMPANTTVTFSLKYLVPSGAVTICNGSSDPGSGYGMQLRGIAMGRA